MPRNPETTTWHSGPNKRFDPHLNLTHFTVRQSGPLTGRISLPGDKSLSHRAVMLGSIACGQTRIAGLLQGDDVKRTIDAFRLCGVQINSDANDVVIEGVGLNGLNAPQKEIYCGNSGTSMRLLTGLFAGQKFETILTGDDSLMRRPMRRVVDPFAADGCENQSRQRRNAAGPHQTRRRIESHRLDDDGRPARRSNPQFFSLQFRQGDGPAWLNQF